MAFFGIIMLLIALFFLQRSSLFRLEQQITSDIQLLQNTYLSATEAVPALQKKDSLSLLQREALADLNNARAALEEQTFARDIVTRMSELHQEINKFLAYLPDEDVLHTDPAVVTLRTKLKRGQPIHTAIRIYNEHVVVWNAKIQDPLHAAAKASTHATPFPILSPDGKLEAASSISL